MATEKKPMTIGMVILLIGSIFALVYSVVAFLSPAIFVTKSFSGATGQAWPDFVSSSPDIANYILGLERTLAGFAFAVVIAVFFVLFTAFKRQEQWAWYCILVVCLLAWLNNLVGSAIAGKSSLSLILTLIGIGLFILGIVLSAKDFFGKKKA